MSTTDKKDKPPVSTKNKTTPTGKPTKTNKSATVRHTG